MNSGDFMLINLSEILTREQYTVQKEVEAEFTEFSSRMGTFPVKEKEKFLLELTHVKDGEIRIAGKTALVFTAPCGRCLEDVDVKVDVDFEKTVHLKREDVSGENDLEETNYIDGYTLDVDKLIYGEVLIGWPTKILCSEDCKGICNVCGQNLNQGTCSCEDTSLDPRMSVIRDVFKNFKEV